MFGGHAVIFLRSPGSVTQRDRERSVWPIGQQLQIFIDYLIFLHKKSAGLGFLRSQEQLRDSLGHCLDLVQSFPELIWSSQRYSRTPAKLLQRFLMLKGSLYRVCQELLGSSLGQESLVFDNSLGTLGIEKLESFLLSYQFQQACCSKLNAQIR